MATSAADAKVMLEALEAGADGVVLATESPAEVRELRLFSIQRESSQL